MRMSTQFLIKNQYYVRHNIKSSGTNQPRALLKLFFCFQTFQIPYIACILGNRPVCGKNSRRGNIIKRHFIPLCFFLYVQFANFVLRSVI